MFNQWFKKSFHFHQVLVIYNSLRLKTCFTHLYMWRNQHNLKKKIDTRRQHLFFFSCKQCRKNVRKYVALVPTRALTDVDATTDNKNTWWECWMGRQQTRCVAGREGWSTHLNLFLKKS